MNAAPLIVTLEVDPASFELLNGLRTEYFPPERNFIPAHVSLFHALPSIERANIERVLDSSSGATAEFALTFDSVVSLGAGFAVRVESSRLRELHRDLADLFASWLTPQDRQAYRPHVTLMNKATPELARAAWAGFDSKWRPRTGKATGFLLWTYLGGPWQLKARFAFQSSHRKFESDSHPE